MKCRLWALLCAALIVATAGTARSAIRLVPIDAFDTSPQEIILSGQNGSGSSTNAMFDSSILGGYRTLSLNATVNWYGVDATLFAGQTGALVLDTGPDVPMVSANGRRRGSYGTVQASVTWDANGAGLGGLDLTGLGRANSFVLSAAGLDGSDLELGLQVTDTSGNTAAYSRTGVTAGVFSYSFTHFASVNLAAADSLMLTISGPAGVDANIDLLGTYYISPQTTAAVPEPSGLATLGLLCLCGGCGAWWRRSHLQRASNP